MQAIEQRKTPARNLAVTADVMSALGHSTRIKIMLVLNSAGQMSFSELSRKISIEGPVLVHHLDKLINVSLVVKKSNPDPNASQYRLYEITQFGRDTISKIGLNAA